MLGKSSPDVIRNTTLWLSHMPSPPKRAQPSRSSPTFIKAHRHNLYPGTETTASSKGIVQLLRSALRLSETSE